MIQEELEHFAAGQLDELTPEAAMVLGDKELILASMNTSHDIHLGKIDGLEDKIVTNERKNFHSMMEKV